MPAATHLALSSKDTERWAGTNVKGTLGFLALGSPWRALSLVSLWRIEGSVQKEREAQPLSSQKLWDVYPL